VKGESGGRKWSEVKWSEVKEVKWSEVKWSEGRKWSEVKWSEVKEVKWKKWSEGNEVKEVKWSEVKWSEVKWREGSEVKEVKWSEVKWRKWSEGNEVTEGSEGRTELRCQVDHDRGSWNVGHRRGASGGLKSDGDQKGHEQAHVGVFQDVPNDDPSVRFPV
jgi:hypothetical protein